MYKKIFISFLSFVLVLLPIKSYSDSTKTIVLKINSKIAYVNFQPVTLDIAPIERNGRTLVPLRFLSEHFGAKNISYNPSTEEITIELYDPDALRTENTNLTNEVSNLKTEIETLKNRIKELEEQASKSKQPPTAPSNLYGYVSSKQIFLLWNASNQGTNPIAGYKLYRSEDSNSSFINIAVLPPSVLTFTDTQVLDGKTYIYYVKAFDTANPANESAESNKITIQIPVTQPPPEQPPQNKPPTAPSNLQAIVNNNQVQLNWYQAKEGSYAINGYKIYRSTNYSTNFQLISSVTTPTLSYSDYSVSEGSTYTYFVTAYDTATPSNESEGSNRVDVQIQKNEIPKVSPPSAPSYLQASVLNKQVNLSWSASRAGTNSISGYKVYRATDGSSNFNVITSLTAYTLSYTDSQVTEGTSYTYYVTAFDIATPPNESEGSNKATITIKSSSNDDVTVYITDSGKKYHKDGCRYLKTSKIPITLKEAKAQGYTPCSVCKPPTLNGKIFVHSLSESGKIIVLKINSKTAYVNNQPVTLDIAPIEIKGRTLVPLRFLSEHFGAKKITYFVDTEEIAIELDDITTLRTENATLSNQVTNLKSEIETLKNRIKELEGQTPNPQIQPPLPPGGLQGFVFNSQVFLTWKPSAQGTYSIGGYKIFRSEMGTTEFVTISILPPDSITFNDPQVTLGKSYAYFIKAFDTALPYNESQESIRLLLAIPATQDQPVENITLDVSFLDVGQGDSFLIRTKNNTILIDGGEASAHVSDKLLGMGINHIDLLIATHPDSDHIGGLYDVMNKITFDEIMDSGVQSTSQTYLKYMGYILDHSKKLTIGRDGDIRNIDGVIMKLLNPPEPTTSETNENSIVLTLSSGKINYLFMADAALTTERQIVTKYPNLACTILKVSHHGSIYSTSTEFLQQIQPKISVVSVGKNSYGHPSEEVLQRIRDIGSKIYRTDKNGNVNITTDGINYSVKIEKNESLSTINWRYQNETIACFSVNISLCVGI